MDFIDYYNILGLDKNASQEDIKKAYRKLARKHHPDLNPNDAAANKKFQQINEANEVLSNPENRKKYDQYGKDWQHADQFEQAKRNQQQQSSSFKGDPGQFYSDQFGDDQASDFFESIFGKRSGSGRTGKFRGQDYESEFQLNLSDAYATHQQTLTVNGKNIRITIPAGVENGQKIRLKGHGGPGVNGGPSGDLYITFSVVNNTSFKRSGTDLYADADMDLYTALLGGELTLETLGGKVKLKIKPGTQNNTRIRLKGKGFPVYREEGRFGDLYITLQVNLPTELNDQQKELFRQLSEM